ncbi:peptidylprolyl isomerase [Chamaesiphon minutus]|uniref:peptidylprolyl isomerase n=1 Tax=Chamaesiphon minutus (strain ATCC 27169 / PCC 6605) TaxID=1173020 RepID=K9U9N0_CHAP6|nr:peptidylprolyl isomerase [Chamaesiphon minutus]AFY91787.1 parvulin-like peptidyl-prolyl isomerase [Chamaesiphon minutus PCC 6605]
MIANIERKITERDLINEAKLAGKIPELMRGIIRRQVIEQQVRKAGISPTTADLQQAADKFRLVNKLESAAATQKWLAERFLSVDDFEEMVTQELISQQLARYLFGDRVEQFFYQNLVEYTSAIIYEVILEDRNLAMELFYSLQEGDLSFADVAYQYIPNPELRRRGGYIGKVGRKQLRPEISATIFAAKPPQLLAPIVTAVGVHLIQVEEIVEPRLDDDLRQQILMEMFDLWLADAIAAYPQCPIEI